MLTNKKGTRNCIDNRGCGLCAVNDSDCAMGLFLQDVQELFVVALDPREILARDSGLACTISL